MIEPLATLATLVTLCICMLVRPTHVVCPVGWYVNGVRSDGRTECMPKPIGDETLTPSGIVDHSVQPPGYVRVRIYCTGGSRPIVVNDRTVGCQR